jgi:hypothetical protein
VYQVAHALQHAVDGVGEIARHLLHPGAVRLANDAGDLDTSRLDVDDEEDVVADQADEREYLNGEEVGSRDGAEMGLEERLPRHPLASRRRGFKAVLEEDALDGVAAESVAEIAQRSSNPGVAPARVARGEPDDELPYAVRTGGATRFASSSAVILPGDELTVPAQNRVRCHQSGDLVQHASAQYPTFRREASALVVSEPRPPLAQLLAEDAVLLLQVVDHRVLATVDPAREKQEQELQRRGRHGDPMVACLR